MPPGRLLRWQYPSSVIHFLHRCRRPLRRPKRARRGGVPPAAGGGVPARPTRVQRLATAPRVRTATAVRRRRHAPTRGVYEICGEASPRPDPPRLWGHHQGRESHPSQRLRHMIAQTAAQGHCPVAPTGMSGCHRTNVPPGRPAQRHAAAVGGGRTMAARSPRAAAPPSTPPVGATWRCWRRRGSVRGGGVGSVCPRPRCREQTRAPRPRPLAAAPPLPSRGGGPPCAAAATASVPRRRPPRRQPREPTPALRTRARPSRGARHAPVSVLCSAACPHCPTFHCATLLPSFPWAPRVLLRIPTTASPHPRAVYGTPTPPLPL